MLELVKRIFADSECPDCGFFFACDKCSERFDAVDEEIKKVELNPTDMEHGWGEK